MIAAIPRKIGSSWCEILVGTAHHAPPLYLTKTE